MLVVQINPRSCQMLDRLKERLLSPRMIVSLILAVIIVGATHLITNINLIEKLQRLAGFTEYVDSSLTSVDTFKIVNVFYYEFIGCEIEGDFPKYGINCSGDGLSGPRMTETESRIYGQEKKLSQRFVEAVFNAIGRLWSESTWLGLAIFVPAMWVAGVFVHSRLPGENDFLDFLYFVFATPVVASGIALALKVLLLVLVWIFSAALGGVIWVVVTLSGFSFWISRGVEVYSTAHNIAEFQRESTRRESTKKDTDQK